MTTMMITMTMTVMMTMTMVIYLSLFSRNNMMTIMVTITILPMISITAIAATPAYLTVINHFYKRKNYTKCCAPFNLSRLSVKIDYVSGHLIQRTFRNPGRLQNNILPLTLAVATEEIFIVVLERGGRRQGKEGGGRERKM